nr:putative transposase En/Spm [Ipomoea batatas]
MEPKRCVYLDLGAIGLAVGRLSELRRRFSKACAEQTEKTKRDGVLSEGRKPVGKVELGEMRILFSVGVHGGFELRSRRKKRFSFGCCWDEVNSGLKRKITKKIEGKDMVGARASLDEEEGSDGVSLLEASMENSGSKGDLQGEMNERKLNIMQLNRELAWRSRMRKQKHLDDLVAQETASQIQQNQPELDQATAWYEATGGVKKRGYVFGFGSDTQHYFPEVAKQKSRHGESSSHVACDEKIEHLQQTNKEIIEQNKKIMELL